MKMFVVSGRMRRGLGNGSSYSEDFRFVDEADNADRAIEYRKQDLEDIGWNVTSIQAEEKTA